MENKTKLLLITLALCALETAVLGPMFYYKDIDLVKIAKRCWSVFELHLVFLFLVFVFTNTSLSNIPKWLPNLTLSVNIGLAFTWIHSLGCLWALFCEVFHGIDGASRTIILTLSILQVIEVPWLYLTYKHAQKQYDEQDSSISNVLSSMTTIQKIMLLCLVALTLVELWSVFLAFANTNLNIKPAHNIILHWPYLAYTGLLVFTSIEHRESWHLNFTPLFSFFLLGAQLYQVVKTFSIHGEDNIWPVLGIITVFFSIFEFLTLVTAFGCSLFLWKQATSRIHTKIPKVATVMFLIFGLCWFIFWMISTYFEINSSVRETCTTRVTLRGSFLFIMLSAATAYWGWVKSYKPYMFLASIISGLSIIETTRVFSPLIKSFYSTSQFTVGFIVVFSLVVQAAWLCYLITELRSESFSNQNNLPSFVLNESKRISIKLILICLFVCYTSRLITTLTSSSLDNINLDSLEPSLLQVFAFVLCLYYSSQSSIFFGKLAFYATLFSMLFSLSSFGSRISHIINGYNYYGSPTLDYIQISICLFEILLCFIIGNLLSKELKTTKEDDLEAMLLRNDEPRSTYLKNLV